MTAGSLMNSCSVALIALLVASPAPIPISGSGFRMALPPPITTHTETVRLPWGAVETVRHSGDVANDTLVIFGTYDWQSGRAMVGPAGLRKTRAAFLRNRGCSAHDVRGDVLRDAEGTLWPQTTFEGECEGGDSFAATFLVVRGALYHFQAVQQATIHPHPRPPLGQVVRELVGSFSAND
jgi:hypothetical protein